MEGIFISLIVFGAILGSVIYYGIIFGKFGRTIQNIGTQVTSLPTRLIELAGDGIDNTYRVLVKDKKNEIGFTKPTRLGNGIRGVSRIVGTITSTAVAAPLTFGAFGYNLGKAGYDKVGSLLTRRKNLEEKEYLASPLPYSLTREADIIYTKLNNLTKSRKTWIIEHEEKRRQYEKQSKLDQQRNLEEQNKKLRSS